MREPPDIEAKDLRKRFGATIALRGISLTVGRGTSVALFGSNGSGKTTLLRLLAGLTRPTGGEVHIRGSDYRRSTAAIRRRIGVVSHHPYLYEDLTGEENLLFYGRIYGIPNLTKAVGAALNNAGLAGRSGDRVHTYSRGMQQRLALARATLHDPDILILDEPDTGLDNEAGQWLTEILAPEPDRQRSIVMATHDLRLGASTCERFLILAEGRVKFQADSAGLSFPEMEGLYRNHATAS